PGRAHHRHGHRAPSPRRAGRRGRRPRLSRSWRRGRGVGRHHPRLTATRLHPPDPMSDVTIRRATVGDAAAIARHRAEMFRDMGDLPDDLYAELVDATRAWVERAIPAGEYAAWLALPADGDEVVAGAGVQLRPLIPRPRARREIIAGR